jgi:hypothetical protein
MGRKKSKRQDLFWIHETKSISKPFGAVEVPWSALHFLTPIRRLFLATKRMTYPLTYQLKKMKSRLQEEWDG